ncbi:MAG: hypothetical protein AAGF23_21625 [Acidobacteriota bacterium]
MDSAPADPRLGSPRPWGPRWGLAAALVTVTASVALGLAGGYAFLWIYLFPGSALLLLGRREGSWWIAATVLCTFPWLLGSLGADYPLKALWRFFVTFSVITLFSYGLESSRRRNYEALLARRNSLAEAAERVRTLRGLLPICPSCKKVRDDDGFWRQVEEFVSSRTKVRFSHGLCPVCSASALAELDEPPGASAAADA